MSRANASTVVPIASAPSPAERSVLADLDAFRDLDGLDGVAASIVVLAMRVGGMPRTVGARRPSRREAAARALAILERATGLATAIAKGAS